MKETIVSIKPGPYPKKYTACVKNKQTRKSRKVHFGDSRYEQYKDSTPIHKYANKNHGSTKRRRAYYLRHSGTPSKVAAIKKETRKSGKLYTSKILSHTYLW